MAWSVDRRGQLVLVGALVLATLFVGIALTVNAVIFTENTATRDHEPKDVHGRAAVQESVTGQIRYLDEHNTENRSYPELHDDLRDATANTTRMLQRREAERGASLSVELVAIENGTRIRQTNHDRNFTAGDERAGATTWSVVEGVNETGVFWQNISRLGLAAQSWGTTEAAMANSSYHVAIDEPGTPGVWRVYIFQGAATEKVYVVTEPPHKDYHHSTDAHVDWADACSYTTQEWVRIDIEEALVGGYPCDELRFFEDLDEGYDVYYNQTAQTLDTGVTVNRSKGTYELFVGEAPVDHRPFHRATTDRSPFTTSALFSADVSFAYTTDRLDYRTQFEAQPPRVALASNVPPAVDTFDAHDNVNTDVATDENYTVDWAVSDESGLETVQLVLSANATGTRLDMENVTSVSGTTASGSTELDDASLAEDVDYEIWLVATDTEGATEIRRVLDTADGTDP